ncbi:hypothetical protein EAG_12656 [Camponotus floridanus]|uniref:Uncharacterized protein n=1 Tax=Camponotus floridanus TaxID=104421 RepID=E2AV64_CAMFO|nr:hypothetical protein EAG_12656 [Camponotus floridanus]
MIESFSIEEESSLPLVLFSAFARSGLGFRVVSLVRVESEKVKIAVTNAINPTQAVTSPEDAIRRENGTNLQRQCEYVQTAKNTIAERTSHKTNEKMDPIKLAEILV